MNKKSNIFKIFHFFKLHLYLLTLFFFFIVFTLEGIYLLDPDFGWHLRMGQIILQLHNVPKTDLFSYTMPSYYFIDHEWFSDVIIALIYKLAGIPGVAAIFSLVVIGAIHIATQLAKKKDPYRFWLLLIFMIAGTLVQFSGIRPQVFSWFFFVLVVYLLNLIKDTQAQNSIFLRTTSELRIPKKLSFVRLNFLVFVLLPIIFLLWANMHAAFALGLFYFGFIVVQRLVEKPTGFQIKSEMTGIILSFIVSILITLLNPYGLDLWKEVILTATSPQIGSVEEWTPGITHLIFPLWLFFDIAIVLLVVDRKNIAKMTQVFILLVAILFLFGIRNAPFFLLYTLPFVIDAIGRFITVAHRYKFAKRRLLIAVRIVTVITVIFCLFACSSLLTVLNQSHFNARIAQNLIYPVSSTAYLQKHPFAGQLFTPYNWGGYVIWQLPQKKVFIDGRMPTWNNPDAPKDETTNALQSFMQITSVHTLDATIRKYDISTIMIPPLTQPKNSCGLFQTLCEQTIKQQNTNNNHILQYLQKNHWQEISKDAVSVVYQRSLSREE